VISEPSNPWIAGIGNLFSVDFYAAVRARLRADGIMVQWFHTYEMTDETLQLLLRTFAKSFEHVTLWSPKSGDLILVGSRASPRLSLSMSAARLNEPRIRAELSRLKISSLTTLLSLQISGDKSVREAAGKGSVNQDLFPILEYEAPKAFFLGRASGLLTAFDERLRPPVSSSLYLAAYLEGQQLSVGEIREMALYHLAYGSLTASGLSGPLLASWLERSPNDLEPHWIQARRLQQAGNVEGAFKELQYLLKADPTRPEYLETAGNLELQEYQSRRTVVDRATPDRALGYFRRLLDVQKDHRSATYQKIAEVYGASGDYKAALHYLGEAARHAAENGDGLRAEALWLEVTRVATGINDKKSAMHAVNAALALNPQNRAARQKLQELTAATSPPPEAR
jgi:spermidine synthase